LLDRFQTVILHRFRPSTFSRTADESYLAYGANPVILTTLILYLHHCLVRHSELAFLMFVTSKCWTDYALHLCCRCCYFISWHCLRRKVIL